MNLFLYKKNLRQVKNSNLDLKSKQMESIALWLSKYNRKVTMDDCKKFALILGISKTEFLENLRILEVKPCSLEEQEQTENLWEVKK